MRAYYQIRELAKTNEVYLISIIEEDPSKADLEKIRMITTDINIIRITPLERYISLIKALKTGVPFQIAWFYSNKIKKLILNLASEIKPDHVFCQLTRMAEYALDLPYEKTLDYMDCFGIGMKRRSAVAGWFSSLIYSIEAERMVRYEERVANQFNHLVIISEQDKNQFTFPKAKSIHVLSNGISEAFFQYSGGAEKKYDLVFVGNMSYLPNVESAEYLVQEILPLCKKNTQLLIAGINPASRVLRLASENVTVSGWVEDIRSAYASAYVFVAPMWSGTGQQNKILEAMAMGIPCITTKAVNNAIAASDGNEVIIAETATEFAKAIDHLLNNKNVYETISKNSQRFVKYKFDWKQNGIILSSIFAKKIKPN